jgi:hypothetical protein
LAATDPLVVAAFSAACSAALLLLAWALTRIARLTTQDAVTTRRLDDHDRDLADHEDRLRTLEQRP